MMMHFYSCYRNVGYSPHDEHWSLGPETSKTLFGPVNFFSFYLELYKNKFKNLIRTSKLKFSFRGL